MSQSPHTTETTNAAASGKYSSELIKVIPTLIAAGLIALGTSWCNSQKAQDNILYRVESVEKKAENNAGNILQNSQALQTIAIRQAEITSSQNFLLEQIRDLKSEQAQIKQTLNRK